MNRALHQLFGKFSIACILLTCLHTTNSWAQVQLPANFKDSLISTNWNLVTGFTWDSTGQMYVWEKEGYVHVVDTNGNRNVLLNIKQEVGNFLDQGLNGFVLDPNFRTNGYFYCLYTVDRHHLLKFGTAQYDSTADEYFAATIIRLTRYTANSATNFTTVVPNSRLVLLGETKKTGVPVLYESHGPGTLLFGEDGSLMASVGDGASFDHVDTGSIAATYYVQALADSIIRIEENCGAYRAQMPGSLCGKILRLNPANGDGLASNPLYNASLPRSPQSRMWALGLRNSYRMSLRPGTGSTDITAGDPGTIYSGEVGWFSWEEMNTCEGPNQNFGWPLYEGLETGIGYQNDVILNRDAPNPFYPSGSCKQFLAFKELLQQPTANGVVNFPLLCNGSFTVPANIPHWVHSRPDIEYAHASNTTRTGIFSGNLASIVNINSGSSPISGAMFGGYASIGGQWNPSNKFPVQYQNKYFHADYVNQWIKVFTYNAADSMVSIVPFADSVGTVVHLKFHPKNGNLYYFRYPDEIRVIKYSTSVNNFPTAVASQNITYGAAPLTVNFNGALSSDPENLPLTYLWNFGDGFTSGAMSPSHPFNASATPTTYTVTLTVTDNVGQSDVKTLKVYVNNTPPQITIVSPVNNSFYTMSGISPVTLNATAVDNEHTAGQLSYQWQKIFHHNQHVHPDSPVNSNPTNNVITPAGCNGETYYYEFKVTVTDAAGLSSTASTFVYPACNPPVSDFSANFTTVCAGAAVQFSDLSSSLPDNYQWTFTGGTPSSSTQKNPTVTYNTAGTYSVTLNATNGYGGTPVTKTNYITVGSTISATITGNNSICPGQSTVLTANAGAGLTYQWQENGANIAGATNQTLTVVDSGAYRVIITSTPGCTGTSAIKTITLTGTITATISGNNSICAGQSTLLTANSGGGYTYQWQENGANIAGATNQTYLVTDSGAYRVIITSGGCTGTSAVKTITLTGTLIASVTPSGTASFCAGSSTTLTANTGSGITYQWYRNGSAISGATGSTYAANNSGTFYVRETSTCGTVNSNSVVVTQINNPDATISYNSPLAFCAPGSVLLTANTYSGVTYQWQKNGTDIAGATNQTYSATSNGTYRVRQTANGCSKYGVAVSTTSTTIVTAAITANGPVTFCTGGSVVLSVTGAVPGYSYQWKNNNVNIGGATTSSYTATAAGIFTCTVTANCGSATSNIIQVSTNGITATIVPAGSVIICNGGTAALSTNTGAGYAHQWYLDGNLINGATSSTYNATAGGSYTVAITSPCGNATAAATTVSIAAVTATITPSGTATICAGSAQTFAANTGYNYTYKWFRNGTEQVGATSSTYSNSSYGTYTVRITQGGTCIATSAGTLLNVTSNPTATITAGGPTTFCAGQSVTLTSSTFAGVGYQWLKNNNEIAGATNQTYTATTTGSYGVKQTANGCSLKSVAIGVTVNCRVAGEGASDDLNSDVEINVFPNPFTHYTTIQILNTNAPSQIAIELYDVIGRKIKSMVTENAELKLQRENLKPGVYFLLAKYNGQVICSKKIIAE